MTDELVSQIALELIPGIGSKGIRQLISYCGSSEEVFNAPKGRLLKIPGVSEKMAEVIRSANTFKEAEDIIKSNEVTGTEILHYTDKKFPQRLKLAPDSPNIIYTKGNGDLNPEKCVAIVGSRRATDYGKKITDKIIEELTPYHPTVISGFAYGIDIQAHKGSLENNIPTFAILAGGLDQIYPSQHCKYVKEILKDGGIITESMAGIRPGGAHSFPARNRIIAGMADAVIVVEASERGGALITARIADSYNRLVLAVPGNIGNTYSSGTNKLIAAQKALIYSNINDLIEHLNWDLETESQKIEKALPEMDDQETIIFHLLAENAHPLEIDIISIKSQIPINQVASLLLSLEFKNLVKSFPGKKYGRVK